MNRRILIIEDDRWMAESLAQTLGQEFDVRVSCDAQRSLDVVESWRPDVMLADVILGSQNVFALLHEMQSYDDLCAIPVVILSSNAAKIVTDDVRNLNVKLVLDKAEITPKLLREKLRNLRIERDELGRKNG